MMDWLPCRVYSRLTPNVPGIDYRSIVTLIKMKRLLKMNQLIELILICIRIIGHSIILVFPAEVYKRFVYATLKMTLEHFQLAMK